MDSKSLVDAKALLCWSLFTVRRNNNWNDHLGNVDAGQIAVVVSSDGGGCGDAGLL